VRRAHIPLHLDLVQSGGSAFTLVPSCLTSITRKERMKRTIVTVAVLMLISQFGRAQDGPYISASVTAPQSMAGPLASPAVETVACTDTNDSNDLTALNNAIAALTPNGGSIILDPLHHCYLDLSGATGTAALTITAPISIYGPGTLDFGNIPSTMARIHFAPAAENPIPGLGPSFYVNNLVWSNFTIEDATAPGVYVSNNDVGLAEHSIWLDASNNSVSNFTVKNVRSLPVASGGKGIFLNNSTSGGIAPNQTAVNSNGGWYVSSVQNSQIWNGIYAYNSGDTLNFTGNQIDGLGDGIYIASIPGATVNTIVQNSIVTAGCPIRLDGGLDFTIDDNEIGISAFLPTTATTGTICIDAAVSQVYGVNISGGYVGVDQSATQKLPLISVGAEAFAVKVGGRVVLAPPTGVPAISNNGNATCVDPGGVILPKIGSTLMSGDGSYCGQDGATAGGLGQQIENRLVYSTDLTQTSVWVPQTIGAGVAPTTSIITLPLPGNGASGSVSQLYLNCASCSVSTDSSYLLQTVPGLTNPHTTSGGVWLRSNLFITGASSTGTAITYLIADTSSTAVGSTFTVANALPVGCNASGTVTDINAGVSVTISSTNSCAWTSGGDVVFTVDVIAGESSSLVTVGYATNGYPNFGWTYVQLGLPSAVAATTDKFMLRTFGGGSYSLTANLGVYAPRLTRNFGVPYVPTQSTSQPLTYGIPAANLVGPMPTPIIASVAPTLYSGTTSTRLTTLYTPRTSGLYRVCGYLDVIVAANAATSAELLFNYISDGHNFSGGLTGSSVVATTQWTQSYACQVLYLDASQPFQSEVFLAGVTGSPTFRYALTLEKME
jgi:hypothetical protein